MNKGLKNRDYYRAFAPLYRSLSNNIYRMKDGKYFLFHHSFNSDNVLNMLDLPLDNKDAVTRSQVLEIYGAAAAKQTAQEVQYKSDIVYRQAGTICSSVEEFLQSDTHEAIKDKSLYDLQRVPNSHQSASYWPTPHSQGDTIRPLAGLKVLDLSRVLAAPSVARSLAEYGATVLKITGPELPDFWVLLPDMNNGKLTAEIDLKSAQGKAQFEKLLEDVDVIIDGYRPGTMEHLGYGRERVTEMLKHRDRGVVYLRENCYGWYGPRKDYSGWQNISDACTGVAWENGRSMGLDEPIIPYFPNSDFGTGAAGVSAVLNALIRRGREGGSWWIDVSLNYYSQWLIKTVGKYKASEWQNLWNRYEKVTWRYNNGMGETTDKMLTLMKSHSPWLFKDEFFETRQGPMGNVRYVAPVVSLGNQKGRYDEPTRDNAYDEPVWP